MTETEARRRKITMADTSTSSGGVGFSGLLTLLFIGLKLGHVIDWPWIWVLAPLWIGLVLAVVVVLAVLSVLGIAHVLGGRR